MHTVAVVLANTRHSIYRIRLAIYYIKTPNNAKYFHWKYKLIDLFAKALKYRELVLRIIAYIVQLKGI